MAVAGGWGSIKYVIKTARKIGFGPLYRAVRSKNACKTCAFGTGGQNGGMHNESLRGIEVCNKNIQSQITDIQAAIPAALFQQRSIAELSQFKIGALERLGRLETPLYKKAGDTHYQAIDYETALDKIINQLKRTSPKRSFFYTSGRSSNEAAFVLQLFARLYGTNNVNNCSFYCHQASGEGLNSSLGTGTATIQFQDLAQADLIVVFGANPSSNHPRFMKSLLHCRRRGGHVIIVNPNKEPGLVKFAVPSDLRSLFGGGSDIASLYIQPHIGGDIAFIKAVAKQCIETECLDSDFIQQHCNGFDVYRKDIQNTHWEELIATAGVDKTTINRVAEIYKQSKNAIFAWGMGVTHHLHGVANVESIANLALLRGMVGRPGAGLLPLRGHSNVQGVGSMGVTPQLKALVFDNVEKNLGVKLPMDVGMDTMACMQAAQQGDIDYAFLLGGNLLAANPDTKLATQALNNIPFKLFINSNLNQGHVQGVDQEVIILPVVVRDEEKQATTQESMFNYVRMSDGNIIRFQTLKSETEIICDIASAVIDHNKLDFAQFKQHRNIRHAIANIIPGFSKMAALDASKEEFHISGRAFTSPRFNTSDNKAHFQVVSLPAKRSSVDELQMMTIRSEGQFNTIVYEHHDVYREQTSRWVVLMNTQDMQKYQLQENDQITLKNATGEMRNLRVKPFAIRAGNVATYYPEANVLVPVTVDPRSKTPAFKSVAVNLVKH